jgi:hypothetical protein
MWDETFETCSSVSSGRRYMYTSGSLVYLYLRKIYTSPPLGRPRHRWEDNIKKDLKEAGWRGVDWIDLD